MTPEKNKSILHGRRDASQQARRAGRLMMAGFAIILAAMWAAIGYYIAQSRTARIEEEQRVLARVVHSVREQTHALFTLLDYFLVSADHFFRRHPSADPRTDPEFLHLVREFRTKTADRIDIRFVSANGGLYYVGTPKERPLADVSDRDYFQTHGHPDGTHGLFIAKPVFSRVTQRWGLPISYPLHTRPQGVSVIFAAIENRVLAQAFEEGRTKPNGTTLLAHHDGTILFRSPDIGVTGHSLAPVPEWFDKALANKEGVFHLERSPLDRQSRIGAYTMVPDYPLVVITTSTTEDTLAGWRARSLGLVLFGLAATVLGAGMLARMSRFMHDLAVTRQKLEHLALTDELTGLPNRRHLMEQGQLETLRATRYEHPLSLLMLDIDHFKDVNDTHGHESGDRTLQMVARTLQAELRTTDLPGRIGGEELAVLLPETELDAALAIAERLRQAIEQAPTAGGDDRPISVTVSVGVAALERSDLSFDQLLARADRALYRAKHEGRNCVRTDAEAV